WDQSACRSAIAALACSSTFSASLIFSGRTRFRTSSSNEATGPISRGAIAMTPPSSYVLTLEIQTVAHVLGGLGGEQGTPVVLSFDLLDVTDAPVVGGERESEGAEGLLEARHVLAHRVYRVLRARRVAFWHDLVPCSRLELPQANRAGRA